MIKDHADIYLPGDWTNLPLLLPDMYLFTEDRLLFFAEDRLLELAEDRLLEFEAIGWAP